MAVVKDLPLRYTAAAAGILLAVITGYRLLAGDGADTLPGTPPAAASAAGSRPVFAAPRSDAARRPAERPSDPARIFELGLAGDLVIDIDTQASLEMTLSELGADPSAADLQRLEDGLRQGLPPTAANEAITLFRQYVAYSRDYARSIEGSPPADTPDQVRAMLDRTEALQRRHFGEANAKALFGLQMAHSRHQLDVQAVIDNTQLSAADKTARIQALRERLPAEVRELDTEPVNVAPAASAGS